ncbi:hypothetical protein [Brachybacterium sp. GPGPB12]|uniref:hypothetical protein n=1 Tax=Brachybacterium sp. GPGPB12 TaxID=3023517 RepID=UPI00313432E8
MLLGGGRRRRRGACAHGGGPPWRGRTPSLSNFPLLIYAWEAVPHNPGIRRTPNADDGDEHGRAREDGPDAVHPPARAQPLRRACAPLQTAPSPTSRAGLATLTRLTKPTVSKLVEELIGAGLVTEGEPIAAGAGRPMVPPRTASGTLLAIGLEIAADHISCLGIDLTGAELARRTTYHRVAEGTAEDALALAARSSTRCGRRRRGRRWSA